MAGSWYVGVGTNPAAGVDGASIGWSWQVTGSTCRCVEAGVARTGSASMAGYVWIRRRAGLLQYLTGPDIASATVKRSIADPGGVLFFDSSLGSAGVSIEVRFDALGGTTAQPRRRLTLSLGL